MKNTKFKFIQNINIKINWNAFWIIGGTLIAAILATVAFNGIGDLTDKTWTIVQKTMDSIESANNIGHYTHGIEHLRTTHYLDFTNFSVGASWVLAFAWLSFCLSIGALFTERKTFRSSLYALVFILELFVVLIGLNAFSSWIYSITYTIDTGDGHSWTGGYEASETIIIGSAKVFIALIAVAFVFQLVGSAVWLGLGNRKDKKSDTFEIGTVQIKSKLKIVWNSAYIIMGSILAALVVTGISSIYGQMSSDRPGQPAPMFAMLIIIAIVLSWVSLAVSILGVFFNNKHAARSIFAAVLILHIVAAALMLIGLFMSSSQGFTSWIFALITFIVLIVSCPVIDSRYLKSLKKERKLAKTNQVIA